MDKGKLDKLKDIKIENFVWAIYIIIIILSYYANSIEKKFLLYDDEKSKKEYQGLMIFIFLILLIVYYYFAYDGYNKIKELNDSDSNKKKVLSYATFIGSFLILISGIIFLYILIVDDEIEAEIAFN
jgi:anaerobic C4-dicarboxylate transporter